MNALHRLTACGQSVWLDDIHRGLLSSGQLADLVADDGVSGVTSNPTIFQKALAAGADYDPSIRAMLRAQPGAAAEALYERLLLEDLLGAADVLRPVFDATHGADGYVSMEVSPKLADDTDATLADVRRLWRALDRPNVMVKIPGNAAGIPAIEQAIAEDIHVNVTLMFSMSHYEAVAAAFLRGVARCARPADAASVASFFVSRVDTKIDAALEAIGSPEALALRGRVAIASSRRVHRRYRDIFEGEPGAARLRGARPQRILWASTSTKNPSYPDVLYLEQLVGPGTIDTMTLESIRALKTHGEIACDAIDCDSAGADETIAELTRLGIISRPSGTSSSARASPRSRARSTPCSRRWKSAAAAWPREPFQARPGRRGGCSAPCVSRVIARQSGSLE